MAKNQDKYVARAIRESKKNKGVPKVIDVIGDYEDSDSVEIEGDKYGKCSVCGKMFEQPVSPNGKKYLDLTECPDCKKKMESKVNTRKKEVEVSSAILPFHPYPWQMKAFEDFKTHRFNLWACGNRSGKDFCANMIGIWYFVQCLNENRAVLKPTMAPSVQWWIIAPTEPMAAQNWRDLKKQFPKEWIVSVRDSDMVMNTVGNGLIEVKSAFNAENLVGVGLDLVTITEAARVKNLDVVWGNIEPRLGSQGRGLIADRKGGDAGAGKAIINSTPIGKNFFYTMWKWGQEGTDEHSSEWISYQLPWTVNPTNKELADRPVKTRYGVMSYEEDIRRRIGERLFRQNYLADFLAGDGSVFKDFDERCVKRLYDMGLNKKQQDEYVKQWKDPIPYHSYRIGYDPATGSSSDTPAVIVRDMNTNNIVLVADLYGKNYDQQWDEIAYISRYYNYAPCAWLRTGHTAIENQLAKRGVVEIPLDEQGGKKAQYIQSLERAIQNDDLHVLLDGTQEVQTFVMQMGDYSEHDGKYSNETQPHDDFVSACYAAYYDYSDATEKIFYCGLMGGINRYGKNALS